MEESIKNHNVVICCDNENDALELINAIQVYKAIIAKSTQRLPCWVYSPELPKKSGTYWCLLDDKLGSKNGAYFDGKKWETYVGEFILAFLDEDGLPTKNLILPIHQLNDEQWVYVKVEYNEDGMALTRKSGDTFTAKHTRRNEGFIDFFHDKDIE